MNARYSFGGDEHLFVEIAEQMSLDAFFKSMSMVEQIKKLEMDGIDEICLANASLQIKYNPDLLPSDVLLRELRKIEEELDINRSEINTRIIEIPVFYQDPFTHEVLMRFRDRHQDAESTDIEYAAKINGYKSAQDFIDAHSGSPWMVTMVGFVAGLPFMFQMVEQDKQIEVPKYVSPRTDTPKLTLGYGGCFSCIYSVRGAGGYQMLGIIPTPIFDPKGEVSYLKDFMVFFSPGDIVKFTPISEKEYSEIEQQVKQGVYKPNIRSVTFNLKEFKQDISIYNKQLEDILYGN